MKLVVALVIAAALAVPAAASAQGDPIMPLSQVQRGMHCNALSVIHGTDISSFDVEVLEVITGDGGQDARILVRVSGPAVDGTGIGPGFSGSPIYCADGDGVARNIGAISEGIGDYGNKVALATPIEQMLDEPVTPPAAARRDPALLRSAHRYALPLTFGGVSAPLASVIRRVAAHAGRTVLAGPAAPRDASAPAPALQPGSAFSVGYSSGDLSSGAIGTVAYVDGDQLWGFGHPLDSVGRRDLFLQSAYVYDVVNNPLGIGDASSYKLAAPGQDVGTLLGDGINAVTGRVGALPDSFPMKVSALDQDTGRKVYLNSQIADETPVGNPSGASAASGIAAIAAGEASYEVLRGSPSRQSGNLCLRITIQERAKPLGFCNTYVGGTPGQTGIVGSPMVSDVSQAVTLLDDYQFASLHVKAIDIDLRARRGLSQAYLVGLNGPRVLRRGRTYSFTAQLRRIRGPKLTKTLRIRVSRGVRAGVHQLVVHGTPSDTSGAPSDSELAIVLGLDSGSTSDDPGSRSVADLAHAIAKIHRYDGVTADFRGGRGLESSRRVFRDLNLRVSGTARYDVLIRP
ncbi:MAG: hypothetical protein QOH62_718 [Solirubrobacteraceae bacterium]|nr:hypothetical protein [Solirubrobacteraceae bacterium]